MSKVQFDSLEDIAYLLIEVGQHAEAAVRFLGAAHLLRQETEIGVPLDHQATYDDALNTLRQRLGDDVFDAQWLAGQTTTLAEIVTEATTLTV